MPALARRFQPLPAAPPSRYRIGYRIGCRIRCAIRYQITTSRALTAIGVNGGRLLTLLNAVS